MRGSSAERNLFRAAFLILGLRLFYYFKGKIDLVLKRGLMREMMEERMYIKI